MHIWWRLVMVLGITLQTAFLVWLLRRVATQAAAAPVPLPEAPPLDPELPAE